MNNGDDTACYLSFGYRVIAVEAAPDLIDKAQNRFKDYIAGNRLNLLNLGIAESNDYLDFYLNKYDSGWSSFHLNLADRGGAGYETIKIKTKTLDQLMVEHGVPYYMKIDIEGNDRVALDSLMKSAKKPKYLSIELFDIDEIILLRKLGYSKFKIIDQQNFLPLEIPSTKEYVTYQKLIVLKTSKNTIIRIIRKLFGGIISPILEKRYKRLFNYNHKLGSSGPFGEYLPGKWYSLDEIKEVFLFYKNKFEQAPGSKRYGLWVDIHATY